MEERTILEAASIVNQLTIRYLVQPLVNYIYKMLCVFLQVAKVWISYWMVGLR